MVAGVMLSLVLCVVVRVFVLLVGVGDVVVGGVVLVLVGDCVVVVFGSASVDVHVVVGVMVEHVGRRVLCLVCLCRLCEFPCLLWL